MLKNIVCFFLAWLACGTLHAQADSGKGLSEERNIYQRIYDAPLTEAAHGNSISLAQLYEKRPLMLALVYTRCTGICSPYLLQLKDNILFNLRDSSFRVLVLSFDPRDTRQDLQALATRFGLAHQRQWTFATTEQIAPLLASIGFAPRWDSTRRQYDHEALLVGINTGGYITKKLLGIRPSRDLALMAASIHNIYTPSYRLPGNNTLFTCFNYDPKTGRNLPGLGLLLIAFPAFFCILLVVGIRLFVRRQAAS